MKTLKRVMAAEYSRELSVKVHDGVKRVSAAGFRTGGIPGYGLRRMLVSSSREPKCMLAMNERKSIQTDRVILVPGPREEVQCIEEIFRMFVREKKWPAAIAAKLRRDGVAYHGKKRTAWYGQAVNRVLKNPKYCGCSVFGQSTTILQAFRTHNPRELWAVTPGAWQPIIDEVTFEAAQRRFADQTIHKTDAELLASLRRLLEDRGSLSERSFNETRTLPSVEPYRRRFGSLSEAFEKVGYIGEKLKATKTKRARRAMRDGIIAEVVAIDPSLISVIQSNGHFRPRLRVFDLLVSVYTCGCPRTASEWVLNPAIGERNCIALIVLLNAENTGVIAQFVVPETGPHIRWTLRIDDPLLQRGVRLGGISDFISAVRLMAAIRDRANS